MKKLCIIILFTFLNPLYAKAHFFQEMDSTFQKEVVAKFYQKDQLLRKNVQKPSSYGDLSSYFTNSSFSLLVYLSGDPETDRIPLQLNDEDSDQSFDKNVLGFVLYDKGSELMAK